MTKIAPKTTKEHIVNIYNKIELLETNHIYHLQKEVKKLNYILWTITYSLQIPDYKSSLIVEN